MPPRGKETRLLREVVSIERSGSKLTLTLKCGHKVEMRRASSEAAPKRGRCDTCKPTPCGATHRDGRTCTIERTHVGLHDAAGVGRGWNYDARQLDKVAS